MKDTLVATWNVKIASTSTTTCAVRATGSNMHFHKNHGKEKSRENHKGDEIPEISHSTWELNCSTLRLNGQPIRGNGIPQLTPREWPRCVPNHELEVSKTTKNCDKKKAEPGSLLKPNNRADVGPKPLPLSSTPTAEAQIDFRMINLALSSQNRVSTQLNSLLHRIAL